MLTVLNDVPRCWSGPYVGNKLCDAMKTLRSMPIRRIGGMHGSWPPYLAEFEDLLAQAETAELELTQLVQNRTRVLPSVRQIAETEAAICWPAQYLGPGQIARAVNCVALAHSLEQGSDWVASRHGGDPELWRAAHDEGCEIIAEALRRRRITVF